jgi:hypothetical protein
MVRSGPWDAHTVLEPMATAPLRTLPPPTDGILALIGESTLQAKRGRKHPLGHITRPSEHDPYPFGCELVVLMARWDRRRVPLALVPMDPQIKGHQHLLLRQMLQECVPPAWVRQVGVVADAGLAANETWRLIAEKKYASVVAMPRTRTCAHGKHLRDLVQHLPTSCYSRRASWKPDGRRQDSWVFVRHATLHKLGDVTLVLSKQRRHARPTQGKILVTTLAEASAGAMRSIYARRWGVEGTMKELQSGWHWGQRQVTTERERVGRSVVLSVLASLLLLRLYGHDEALIKAWSLCKCKERFIGEVAQEAVARTERPWQRQLQQLKDMA